MLMKKYAAVAVILIIAAVSAFSANTKEVCIKTNLHCESCSQKIEKGLKNTNGVLESKADVETKIVTIKYDADKTDGTKLSKKITDLGYSAEFVTNTGDKCSTDKKNAKSTGKDCCDSKATKSAPKKK